MTKQAVTTEAIFAMRVSNRVLHEGVGHDDEVARQPGAEEQGPGHGQVAPRAKALFAKQEQAVVLELHCVSANHEFSGHVRPG